jgi:hypothetical protein
MKLRILPIAASLVFAARFLHAEPVPAPVAEAPKPAPAVEPAKPAGPKKPAELPPPKPLGNEVGKGLAWLAKAQNSDGGWGQGGGWRVNRQEGQGFVGGFGNHGGEEFISYMNIGEALRAAGGEEWTKWDTSMTKTLHDAQNADGSWAGQHCITGRTFCTASALMVLMTDRAPVPVVAKNETVKP